MNLDLDNEHLLLRRTIRDFANTEVAPGAAHRDQIGEFPAALVAKLAQLGGMGICVPTEYGGAAMDPIASCILVEELSRADASLGIIVSVQNSLVIDPILKYATDEQKRQVLPKLATAEWIGCFSLTEPNYGSDATKISTSAVLSDDGWHITGTKVFVTNGAEADLILLFAVSDPDEPKRRHSAFLVPKNTPGVIVSKHEDKLGIRSSSTCELVFDDAVVPESALLGNRGEGIKVALHTIDGGRLGVAAQALGIASACLKDSTDYSLERDAFGGKISGLQAIQWKLADMAAEIAASRALLYYGAHLKAKGQRYEMQSAMAKVFASETASHCANHAVQIFGGYGYIKDFPVERYLRDAKITEIYEGTSEIQRQTIARNLLRDPDCIMRI
jgi:butyryl-CoA dehydrogenase